MTPKKKKRKSELQRSPSETSTAFPMDTSALRPPAEHGADAPPDPYQTFARAHRAAVAPTTRWIPGQPLPPPPPEPKPPPPVAAIPPSRPWNPRAYAVASAKFEPMKTPAHHDTINPAEANKPLPLFHGMKSLLLDCEKGKKPPQPVASRESPPPNVQPIPSPPPSDGSKSRSSSPRRG